MMMYPHQPRTLTPREIEAINRQCINRAYDEFDRADGGKPAAQPAPCPSKGSAHA